MSDWKNVRKALIRESGLTPSTHVDRLTDAVFDALEPSVPLSEFNALIADLEAALHKAHIEENYLPVHVVRDILEKHKRGE